MLTLKLLDIATADCLLQTINSDDITTPNSNCVTNKKELCLLAVWLMRPQQQNIRKNRDPALISGRRKVKYHVN